MKKFLLFLFSIQCNIIFAQFGQITAVQIIPANPTDADNVKAVVEVMLGSSPCTLNNTMTNLNGNTIELSNYYCEGMLSMICSRTDTINLGTLGAGNYNLNVNILTGCGPYTLVDSALSNAFVVSVFSSVNLQSDIASMSIFPNPTGDGVLTVNSSTATSYQIMCYNSLGEKVISLSNVTGSQRLQLPPVSGFYFILTQDSNGNVNRFRIVNSSKI